MVNLTFLKTFLVLVREKSFTRTAKLCQMTQPGVSHHLAKLEQYFGVSLVVHGAAKFMLTEAGKRLAVYGHQLSELDENLKTAVANDEPTSGECHFASGGSFGIKMYSFLLDLNRKYRGLVIHYLYRPNPMILEHVLDGTIDVGFMTVHPNDRDTSTQEIDHERLCLVVPKKHRDRSFSGLRRLGFVNHPDGFHHAERLLRANYPSEFAGMDQFPVRAFNNQIMRILEPVALGFGFTALPENAVRSFARAKSVEILDLDAEVIDPILWVQKRARILPQRFDLIKEQFFSAFGV